MTDPCVTATVQIDARPGAVFTGHNGSSSRRWSTKCTVTDAQPGRLWAQRAETE